MLYLTDVPIHSSNVMYDEVERHPLYMYTYVKCIKYWLHIVKLLASRLCRQAYEMLIQQHESEKNNWFADIKKKILGENDFGIIQLLQGVGDVCIRI